MVWDVAVRTFHWLLVACVLIAWFSGGTGLRIHEISGAVVAALLVFRLIWGFSGTAHARFSSFVRSPSALKQYLKDFAQLKADRHIGHNPAGAYMILTLLACLLVIVVTGFLQLTNQFFGVTWVELTHHYAANALIALIPIHVLGAIVSSWIHQENLIGAMIRGRKAAAPPPDGGSGPPSGPFDELLVRVQGAQGFTLLAALVIAGALTGWGMTSSRERTAIVETPATAATAEISKAVQSNAEMLAKDKQDYVVGGPEDASQTWLVSSGGRLYDNWFKALGMPGPSTTHPAWPAANTAVSGETTWRCKSCHGWDYRGREGQYAAGLNATGIIGVQRMRGRDPSQIAQILGNATHKFSDDLVPPHAKYRLALFISKGQHVASQYIQADGRIRGDATVGKPLFQSVCASCHGFDGRARKLSGSSDQPLNEAAAIAVYVGTKANAGPVEVLHKIRNGHPGAIMVSMRPFSMDVAVNLLAYARTLPTN